MQGMEEPCLWPLGQEDSWEEDTTTLSGILAWRKPMDKGAWQSTVHRATGSPSQLKQLNI